MGYAFSGSWSDYSGSTAPLVGGSYNITNTVISQYNEVTNQNPEKLILGVPYYGYKWETINGDAHAETTKNLGSTRFRTEKEKFQIYGTLWDSFSASPWYHYQDAGQWIQSWTDNPQSINEKFALADNYDLGGVGMWALNYDGNAIDFWDIIQERYANISALAEKIEIPDQIRLLGNYPNPFNGQTRIEFYSHEKTSGLLEIFDFNGRKILEQKIKVRAGINSLTWKTDDHLSLASGLYIYSLKMKIKTNVIQLSKKMILIK